MGFFNYASFVTDVTPSSLGPSSPVHFPDFPDSPYLNGYPDSAGGYVILPVLGSPKPLWTPTLDTDATPIPPRATDHGNCSLFRDARTFLTTVYSSLKNAQLCGTFENPLLVLLYTESRMICTAAFIEAGQHLHHAVYHASGPPLGPNLPVSRIRSQIFCQPPLRHPRRRERVRRLPTGRFTNRSGPHDHPAFPCTTRQSFNPVPFGEQRRLLGPPVGYTRCDSNPEAHTHPYPKRVSVRPHVRLDTKKATVHRPHALSFRSIEIRLSII